MITDVAQRMFHVVFLHVTRVEKDLEKRDDLLPGSVIRASILLFSPTYYCSSVKCKGVMMIILCKMTDKFAADR
jgi:hypothetical protein